ncbi:catechol 2,3-dioxygenase-like lactoylglutathione lyase family enzyme [Streptomyces sp. SLBN-118]|uniref:VOC family protein n=1 Tax=Streptomyces sp. SLBN-118 TaxID=2768454 RepID=UPI00114FAFE9|nr:VOC family protein [Streptomyces sp. SLBN-118]TQK44081.1 catechol 2,3-dioxygenase-like lactoylglutathione lyase family enzyme [Streptomyces sp. SLBN-118]
MDWTLEVIVVPVSDVDRARDFYRDKVGFAVDVDTRVTDTMRIVQLTPPGSGCSIVIGEGIGGPDGKGPEPGSYSGMQLVVADIKAAHAELTERGVDVSDPVEIAPGDGGTFMYFADPDGNTWAVQEYRVRATKPLYEVLRPGTADSD